MSSQSLRFASRACGQLALRASAHVERGAAGGSEVFLLESVSQRPRPLHQLRVVTLASGRLVSLRVMRPTALVHVSGERGPQRLAGLSGFSVVVVDERHSIPASSVEAVEPIVNLSTESLCVGGYQRLRNGFVYFPPLGCLEAILHISDLHSYASGTRT